MVNQEDSISETPDNQHSDPPDTTEEQVQEKNIPIEYTPNPATETQENILTVYTIVQEESISPSPDIQPTDPSDTPGEQVQQSIYQTQSRRQSTDATNN